MTTRGAIDQLGKAWEFKIAKDPKDAVIEFIEFKDGRKYKFQHPDFFEIHKAYMSHDADHNLFVFGLKHLYPENDKSPAIDAKYLNVKSDEGLHLWSPLIRGLLLAG